MDFSDALHNFRQGRKLKRPCMDEVLYMALDKDGFYQAPKEVPDKTVEYTITLEDILAEDWELV